MQISRKIKWKFQISKDPLDYFNKQIISDCYINVPIPINLDYYCITVCIPIVAGDPITNYPANLPLPPPGVKEDLGKLLFSWVNDLFILFYNMYIYSFLTSHLSFLSEKSAIWQHWFRLLITSFHERVCLLWNRFIPLKISLYWHDSIPQKSA